MPAPRSQSDPKASDIAEDALVLRYAPAAWRPYLRLARVDRPIGTWLLLLPCWWGVLLALRLPDGFIQAPWHPSALKLLLLFALGALVMRGAGCTWNDITDRDYDAKVARTAGRPIPSGQVSLKRAVAFLAAQLLVGLTILLSFNETTVALGVASLALVFSYPFMKRITWWPQAFLGLTFNWGALMGWTAVTSQLGLPAVALYAAGIAWTLGYDTIYAHQDKEDDALIGVKSTARLFGHTSRRWIMAFYAVMLLLLAVAGWLAGLGLLFHTCLVVVAAQLAWQTRTVSFDDPHDCLAKFRSNRWTGLLVCGAIVLG